MMRILGIDYGEARVGIAISDELKITAQGLETINYNGNDKKLLARLDEIMKEFDRHSYVLHGDILPEAKCEKYKKIMTMKMRLSI